MCSILYSSCFILDSSCTVLYSLKRVRECVLYYLVADRVLYYIVLNILRMCLRLFALRAKMLRFVKILKRQCPGVFTV